MLTPQSVHHQLNKPCAVHQREKQRVGKGAPPSPREAGRTAPTQREGDSHQLKYNLRLKPKRQRKPNSAGLHLVEVRPSERKGRRNPRGPRSGQARLAEGAGEPFLHGSGGAFSVPASVSHLSFFGAVAPAPLRPPLSWVVVPSSSSSFFLFFFFLGGGRGGGRRGGGGGGLLRSHCWWCFSLSPYWCRRFPPPPLWDGGVVPTLCCILW